MPVVLREFRLANLGRLPDGRSFEWEATGDGEPLLWIEGGPGFSAHFARPDAALLARRFQVHLVNAPGCGRTTPPAGREGYDLEHYVEFFESVRTTLGLGRVTLAGHSWGGLVASAYAGLEPEAVRRLLVIDGYAGGGSVDAADANAERERAFDRVRDRPWFDTALRALEADFALRSPTEQESADTFVPAWPLYFADPETPASRAHIRRLEREYRLNVDAADAWDEDSEARDYRALAAKVSCPTLVVVGEHDFICGPVWNRSLAFAIPGARYAEIRGVGHIPQYEDPERFMSVVQAWLSETPAAPE